MDAEELKRRVQGFAIAVNEKMGRAGTAESPPAPRRKVRASDLVTPSAIALVLANLFPIYGVLALGWKVFPILLFYWFENLVVGAFNVARMVAASPRVPAEWAVKFFTVPFFCVHYGLFCYCHGTFLLAVFNGAEPGFDWDFPSPGGFLGAARAAGLVLPLLTVVASHGVSFVTNFIGKGEYRRTSAAVLMMRPYGRIVVMHLTILGGAFLTAFLGSPVWALMVMIALKIAQDLRAHLRERAVLAAGQPGAAPAGA